MPTQRVGYQIKTIKLIGIQFYLSYKNLFLFLVPAFDPRPLRRVTMTQACNPAVSSCFFACLNILMLTRSRWCRLRNTIGVNQLLQCSTCWFMFLPCLHRCCLGPECCNDHPGSECFSLALLAVMCEPTSATITMACRV